LLLAATGAGEQRHRDQLTLREWATLLVFRLGRRRDFAHLRDDVLMRRGGQPCVHSAANLATLLPLVKQKLVILSTTIVQKRFA